MPNNPLAGNPLQDLLMMMSGSPQMPQSSPLLDSTMPGPAAPPDMQYRSMGNELPGGNLATVPALGQPLQNVPPSAPKPGFRDLMKHALGNFMTGMGDAMYTDATGLPPLRIQQQKRQDQLFERQRQMANDAMSHALTLSQIKKNLAAATPGSADMYPIGTMLKSAGLNLPDEVVSRLNTVSADEAGKLAPMLDKILSLNNPLQKKNVHFDADRGVMVDEDTGIASPVMTKGQPLPGGAEGPPQPVPLGPKPQPAKTATHISTFDGKVYLVNTDDKGNVVSKTPLGTAPSVTTADRADEKANLAKKEKVLNYYDGAFSADTRLKLMEGSLPAALKGDQQAMVNLVANHVNMVMGVPRGKVGRVPQALFQEAEKSSPVLQGIKAKFDGRGYLSGVTLTPEQMQSMVQLGRETFDAEKQSADSKADYIGISPEDRPKFSRGQSAPQGIRVRDSKSGKTGTFTGTKEQALKKGLVPF